MFSIHTQITLKNIWNWITDHAGIMIANIAIIALALFFNGCPPTAESLLNPGQQVTRPELEAELQLYIAKAEARFNDIHRQEELRAAFANFAVTWLQGTVPSAAGFAVNCLAILGIGASVDNLRERRKVKTLTKKLNATQPPTA